jgi:hypothetical protein
MYFKNLFWILNNLKFKFAQKNFELFFLYSIFYFWLSCKKLKSKYYIIGKIEKNIKLKNVEVRRAHLLHSTFPFKEFHVRYHRQGREG